MPLSGVSRGYPSSRTVKIQALDSFFTNGRRTWNATLLEEGQQPKPIIIQDPLNEEDYLQHNVSLYEDYGDSTDFLDNLTRSTIVQTYYDSLAAPLGLPAANEAIPSNDAIETIRALKIFVSDTRNDGPFSIHSLMWELLEHENCTKHSGTRIHVIRTINRPPSPLGPLYNPSIRKPFRILLVVSRSWQTSGGHFADLPPALILNTLSYLSEKLAQAGRPFEYDVVRPGTIDGLKESLDRAKALTKPYDLFHFDGHGRIARPNACSANGEPELLFARPYRPKHPNNTMNDNIFDFSDLSFEAYGVGQLASLLEKHGITAAVFNSCNSAYAQNGFISNLSLRLVQYGVPLVVGIKFAIRGTFVKTFCEGFYTSLLVDGNSFEQAVADGRAHLRRIYHTQPLREAEHEPSALPLLFEIADSLVQTTTSVSVLERWFKFFALWEWFVIILYCLSCVKPEWDAMGNTSKWILVPACFLIEFIYSLGLPLDVVNVRWNPLTAHYRQIDREAILEHLHQSSPSLWQGIGMTAVEEQLKLGSTHSAYIQMEDSQPVGKNSPFESYLKTLHTTGFAKDITIVQGADLDTPYWYIKYFLKCQVLWLLEYLKFTAHRLVLFLMRTPRGQHRATFVPPLPEMFVFTEIDLIFEPDTALRTRNRALGLISQLRRIMPNAPDPYLLFIGTSRVGWEDGGINPIHHYWATGRRFLVSSERGVYEPIFG
ncbi:unnamed protein product [Fusarium graminearum]|nr:unnamed protein product [Fusarium graminearum]CZS85658.1 unnamed protein product [Fusarium graminearum]